MRLTHELIEVFRTVMITGNLTRTAELLHTSQPSVSRSVARIEQVVGFPLFERKAGRLKPTSRGQMLFLDVQQSFVGLSSLAARAEVLRTVGAGQVHVAAQPALCETLLAAAAGSFCARYPSAQVRITAISSPDLETALAHQQYDLGVIEQHTPPVDNDLVACFQSDEVLLLPATHELTKFRRIGLKRLEGLSMVSYSSNDPYQRRIDRMLEENGVSRRVVAEANTSATLCALVREGVGVAIVNPLSARRVSVNGLETRRLSVSIPYSAAIVRPTLRPSEQLIDTFIDCLKDVAKRILDD